MTVHLDCVLLIDDDPATNFLHRLTLEDSGQVTTIEEALSGDAALEYLAKSQAGDSPMPQLIFVDINMPRMDGWEFVARLADAGIDPLPTLVMVTTSTNPSDRERASAVAMIKDFLIKPMELENFQEILDRHFNAQQ